MSNPEQIAFEQKVTELEARAEAAEKALVEYVGEVKAERLIARHAREAEPTTEGGHAQDCRVNEPIPSVYKECDCKPTPEPPAVRLNIGHFPGCHAASFDVHQERIVSTGDCTCDHAAVVRLVEDIRKMARNYDSQVERWERDKRTNVPPGDYPAVIYAIGHLFDALAALDGEGGE